MYSTSSQVATKIIIFPYLMVSKKAIKNDIRSSSYTKVYNCLRLLGTI